MTNDPEIRAAVVDLWDAYAATLRASAALVEAMPEELVMEDSFQRLAQMLDALRIPLRVLSEQLEPSNALVQLYDVAAAVLEKRNPLCEKAER